MLIFLKFEMPEIKGEVRHEGFENQIEAWSVSFEATRRGLWESTATGKKSAANPGPVVITKPVDQSSAKLFERTMAGNVNGKVTISCCQMNGVGHSDGKSKAASLYYQIVLQKAHLIRYRTNNVASDPLPVDEIALEYQRIDLLYNKQDGTGNFGGRWEYNLNALR